MLCGIRGLYGTRGTGPRTAAHNTPPRASALPRQRVYRTTTAVPGDGASRSFRDIDAAGRGEPVPLVPHQLDDLVDLALGHAIGGFHAGTRRHRPLVGVDVAVRQQVQVLVEHLPVKLRERQALPAALAENAQYHCGFLHFACLLAWCYSSPVPLRPVDRLSRSPDWPAVTPATNAGTPSP